MFPVNIPPAFFYMFGAAAVSVGLMILAIFLTFPHIILQKFMWFYIIACGMRIKYIKIGDMRWSYGEKGQQRKDKPSLLLIHGFSADKYMWASLASKLRDVHVVAVDMLGHGYSDIPGEDEDLTFLGQLARVHQFVTAVGLNEAPFHIAGISMGGTLAGLYAAHYPDHVDRVTMMCPAMKTTVMNKFSDEVRRIVEMECSNLNDCQCSLLPQTADEVKQMLDFVQYHKTWFPKQVLSGIAEMRRPNNQYFFKLFKSLASLESSELLESVAHKITMPSHLLWGKDDALIDCSGAEILRKRLGNCRQVDILPCCGHTINLDRPGAMAKAMSTFRGEMHNTDKL